MRAWLSFICFFFLSSNFFPQILLPNTNSGNDNLKLDSLQIERIAKTSQLWGHLKYFHPYLDKDSKFWDKAYASVIKEVIKAENKKQFKDAIQKFLSELNDPATYIVENPPDFKYKDSVKYPLISELEESVLYLSIRNYNGLEDLYYCLDQFSSLKDKLPKSSGVIIDLRTNILFPDYLSEYFNYYFQYIQSTLTAKILHMPGFRARYHDGFEIESSDGSPIFSSGYYTKGTTKITPALENADIKIVFICNELSKLPAVAFALQGTGQGFILSEGVLSDKSIVHTKLFELEDGITAELRLDIFAGNKPSPDSILPKGIDDISLINIARQYLNGTIKQKNSIMISADTPRDDQEEISSALLADSYYPDLGNRLLAAAKIWTVIDYFFAYKDLMTENWYNVLIEFIPRFAEASDSLEYNLAVAEMYRHIEDGHGYISSDVLNRFFGTASPPLTVRFIENLPVVESTFPDSIFAFKEITTGDIITGIDGEDVESVITRKMKYRSASNLSTLYYYTSRILLNGSDSSNVVLTIRDKDAKMKTIELPRYNAFTDYIKQLSRGRRDSEPILKFINKDIGYADLDRLTPPMVDTMFEKFKNTKAIIFDMRGYPYGTAWSIAPHLTYKNEVPAAIFLGYSPMNMKIGVEIIENITKGIQNLPPPKKPYYNGLTVMLIDERTQSQAEHTGLFFKAANGTKFFGSQTAGANGNVTSFKIPGKITLFFSALDIRHTDGSQLQKIGLLPDVEVKPTIEGIRTMRDEVLEKAVEYLNNAIN